ncbi:hypothetical protein Lser_V15G31334 [Lactuca serriola]
MPSSSSVSRNSTAGGDSNVPDQFPAGLRVLVVDDDPTCLMILEKMLRNCKYEVTKCNRAEVALSLLRENKNGFDVVISDVHMPDMDGFKLLVHIGLEMDLPVIMMSADDSKSVVMKGVTHGACDYLIKPVRIEALRNIWQHVVRKKKREWKDIDTSASLDDVDRKEEKQAEDPDYSSSANEGHNWKNTKRRKDDEDEGEGEGEERDDSSSLKKPRVVWCVELHQQFVAAVNQLGIDKAVPKKILDLMNVPGITRENVASHLQKYRLYLRRLSGSHQSGGNTPSFFSTPDAGYGSISTLSDLEIQALAASGQLGQLGQLPGQSLATLQAAALGRSGYPKSPISVPLIDQRNIFSFENPQSRYGQVQNRQGHNGNIIRPMNLLHGIPTTMEPKQLVGMQGSFAGLTSQGLIPLNGQSQSQNHVSRQPVLPGQVVSSPGNHVTESTGNRFQLRGNLGIPSYGLVNNGNQIQTRPLQGADLTFDPSLHMNKNMQGGLNVLQHNNYDSGQKIGGNKVIFSTGEGSGTHVVDNSSMLKAEKVNYKSTFCPEEYSQDDLLTAMFTQQQQQEGIGQGENELGLDWYSLDNLPV